MKVLKNITFCIKNTWLWVGALSGIASVGAIFWFATIVDRDLEFFLPGLVYGVLISILFFFQIKRCFWRSISLICVSTVAHYVAFQTAVYSSEYLGYNGGNGFSAKLAVSGSVAGAIGAAILGAAIVVLYPLAAWQKILTQIIGVGAIFGTLLFFVFGIGQRTSYLSCSLLYVPWQAAISYCLSLFYAPVQENKAKLPLQEQR